MSERIHHLLHQFNEMQAKLIHHLLNGEHAVTVDLSALESAIADFSAGVDTALAREAELKAGDNSAAIQAQVDTLVTQAKAATDKLNPPAPAADEAPAEQPVS